MSLVKPNTPMMKQFNGIKKAYPDCILFFRAGDFYEMFGEDAVRASEILQITLTTRNRNSPSAVPMCGVPYHAYEQYLNRLTAAGVKVAICEQMEDPAQAKGVVRREVVRVVTPGTTVSAQLIGEDRDHLLVALAPGRAEQPFGVALVDVSTGLFDVAEISRAHPEWLHDFLLRERPRELLLPEPRSERDAEMLAALRQSIEARFRAGTDRDLAIEEVPAAWFEPRGAGKRLAEHFGTTNLAGFGVEELTPGVGAAGALLAYLEHTQKCELSHLTGLRPRRTDETMWLDEATLAHLEVFRQEATGGRHHTLFAVLNRTCTPMGARLLRRWLVQPLLEHGAIEARLEAVAELEGDALARERLAEALGQVRDLERIVGRVSLPMAGITDLVGLREALEGVQRLPPLLEPLRAPLLRELADRFDPMADLYKFLEERLLPEPALRLHEGGYIAAGVSSELDHLRELSRDSRSVISQLEAREREATGITSLKIRFNKVFGYYLEIPRTHQHKIPASYTRKQTLVNAERYSSLELEELEEKILGAEERIGEIEYGEFQSVRQIVAGYARRLQRTAQRIAAVDVLAALAEVAQSNGYVRPTLHPLDAPRAWRIRAGRHPVIERIDFDEPFIPNDLELNDRDAQILLITGPNMAGKSTVMRQVALIQLMAQAGSFVPASEAELSLVDRIFTRVGAADNLSRGQSTFLLEMNEAANILNNATPRALIVLDEIGRGTSTYDGISIAWAMVEQLHRLGAATLFATHYHELTELGKTLKRLKNFSIAIQEDGEHLVFTRKLLAGEADKSYGIQVARLAGLPEEVVKRAHQVMDMLVAGSNGSAVMLPPTSGQEAAPSRTEGAVGARQQLSFLTDIHPVLERIKELELSNMTPLEALNYLHQAQAKLLQGEDF